MRVRREPEDQPGSPAGIFVAEALAFGSAACHRIPFDAASARLRPESAASLQAIRELIHSRPGTRWVVVAHADRGGGAWLAPRLAMARAEAVVAWLRAHGVAKRQLALHGMGATGNGSTPLRRATTSRR